MKKLAGKFGFSTSIEKEGFESVASYSFMYQS
jgi:hypothetical protein